MRPINLNQSRGAASLAHFLQGLRRHLHGFPIGIINPFAIVENTLEVIEGWVTAFRAFARQLSPASSPPPFIGSSTDFYAKAGVRLGV